MFVSRIVKINRGRRSRVLVYKRARECVCSCWLLAAVSQVSVLIGRREVLRAGWRPVSRVIVRARVLGEEPAVVLVDSPGPEDRSLGQLDARPVLRLRLLLDRGRWPLLVAAHAAARRVYRRRLGQVHRSRLLGNRWLRSERYYRSRWLDVAARRLALLLLLLLLALSLYRTLLHKVDVIFVLWWWRPGNSLQTE